MRFGKHKSWQSYVESLDSPLRFDAEATESERERAFSVLRKGNMHFFRKHKATLPREIRNQLQDGTHASLSHERSEQAKPVLRQFTELLRENCPIPITQEPRMGFYHGDTIVFDLRFDSELSWCEIDEEIPAFFQGFRILRFRQSECDALNEDKTEQKG